MDGFFSSNTNIQMNLLYFSKMKKYGLISSQIRHMMDIKSMKGPIKLKQEKHHVWPS